MCQSKEYQQMCKKREVSRLLHKKDWLGLSEWLKDNDGGGEILLSFLDDPIVQLPKNFVAHVLFQLP